MNDFILIIFGLLPSLIWLSYYLKKDVHPEPKRMVLKIFIYGMIITLPAAFIGITISELLNKMSYFLTISPSPEEINNLFNSSTLSNMTNLNFSSLLFFFIYLLIGVALVEELLKYLVVRYRVLNNAEFDEPTDAMIYMIIAGLGFAALENVLYLFNPELITYSDVFGVNIARFLGAVLLHALWSGTLGYFLALAICERKNALRLFLTGLSTAVLLHAIFNYSIIFMRGWFRISIIFFIIISLALFVSLGFRKIKKMKSVCKI